jgi:hypothetical protein
VRTTRGGLFIAMVRDEKRGVHADWRNRAPSGRHRLATASGLHRALSMAAAPQSTNEEDRLDWLEQKLASVEEQMHRLAQQLRPRLQLAAPGWERSAVNVAHYVALRHEDLRELQARLSELGLSSLGRSEPGVLANLRAVRKTRAGACAGRVRHGRHAHQLRARRA